MSYLYYYFGNVFTPYYICPTIHPRRSLYGTLPSFPEYTGMNRQYPPVDIKDFLNSALEMEALLDDSKSLLHSIQASENFAFQLKDAAQKGDQDTVDQLIKETGVNREVQTQFTPTSIIFLLFDPCCVLRLQLGW
ncbi:hypothetical protein [Thalassobacillus sp. C254]|uniref:hypothetical protein n=1 Tax=Thalassobacillus sp. C254 TaxID=1225341 RepID=UPI0006D009A5|nr:hypothetical protein [Thalassobacillus sp. C254]